MKDNEKNLSNEAAESVAGGGSPEKTILSSDDFIELRSMYANLNHCSKEKAERALLKDGYCTYPEYSHVYLTKPTPT